MIIDPLKPRNSDRMPSRTAVSKPAGDRKLSEDDIEFLTSLAAMQVKYGQPQEAVAYLMQLRKVRPGNETVLRLLVIALMKLDCWPQAAAIIDEIDAQSSGFSRIHYLLRAITKIRFSDLFGAKEQFAKYAETHKSDEEFSHG